MHQHVREEILDILENPYRLHDILLIYLSILKEQKSLHEINCPDCEEKPCKRYYWLFLDVQEIGWKVETLEREMKR